MKILFIIASLGSGGAERVLSNLANSLSKRHDITIATFSNEDPFYTLNKRVTHIKLDLLKVSSSKLESIKNNFNRFSELVRTIKRVDADVNISFMTQTNILSILASKLIGKKIIVSERTVYDFYSSRVVNVLRRAIYPFSNYLLTQTIEDSKNYNFIKKLGVIYNPISIEVLEAKKEKIVLAVGRLDDNKGFDLLIETFATLNSNNWRLIIAGDGVEKENLLHLIKSLKLNNVELIGKRKDIFEWYAKSSIFVLSSKKEGFPNVLLEAMASGCAVVSFDCPYGPSEIIIDKKNGLLVKNQERDELRNAMQKLIDNSSLREELAREALKVKELYAMSKIVEQWEVVIKKVVSHD
jgi:GalNAc-alpha-(1->4)-GalNAc-alpha-(1->3)-diNAcBac-PP-undecaprenol alpha-1,4-N-acetyl-D-galactosaminyltransferase